jgi:hypothetical protein
MRSISDTSITGSLERLTLFERVKSLQSLPRRLCAVMPRLKLRRTAFRADRPTSTDLRSFRSLPRSTLELLPRSTLFERPRKPGIADSVFWHLDFSTGGKSALRGTGPSGSVGRRPPLRLQSAELHGGLVRQVTGSSWHSEWIPMFGLGRSPNRLLLRL